MSNPNLTLKSQILSYPKSQSYNLNPSPKNPNPNQIPKLQIPIPKMTSTFNTANQQFFLRKLTNYNTIQSVCSLCSFCEKVRNNREQSSSTWCLFAVYRTADPTNHKNDQWLTENIRPPNPIPSDWIMKSTKSNQIPIFPCQIESLQFESLPKYAQIAI